jgi:3-methyladenine DNA glycosylase/8-oxoguanine DNA glycosylase
MLNKTKFIVEPIPPFRLDMTAWTGKQENYNFNKNLRSTSGSENNYIKKPVMMSVLQRGPMVLPELAIMNLNSDMNQTQSNNYFIPRENNLILNSETEQNIYQMIIDDVFMRPIETQSTGLKLSRFSSIFDVFMKILPYTQVKINLGITFLSRLSDQYGNIIVDDELSVYTFERPNSLIHFSPQNLTIKNVKQQNSNTSVNMGSDMFNCRINLNDRKVRQDNDDLEYMYLIRKIGTWSTKNIILRGLGQISILPGDDRGIQKQLINIFDLDETEIDLNYWYKNRLKPHVGLVYFCLELNNKANMNLS